MVVACAVACTIPQVHYLLVYTYINIRIGEDSRTRVLLVIATDATDAVLDNATQDGRCLSPFFEETTINNFVLQIHNFAFVIISKNEFTSASTQAGIRFLLLMSNFLLEYFNNARICRSVE